MRAINIARSRTADGWLRVFPKPLCTSLAIFFALFLLTLTTAGLAQEPSSLAIKQVAKQKTEVLAPGIEHIQIIRGYKSEKEATGPWFINMLRIDLSRARLRLVHGMDEAVGLETVSSMAARYGALAAVNSGYFRTTGTYRGDSVGAAVTAGKILSESNNVRAAIGLIEEGTTQKLIFGHIKFEGQVIAGSQAKREINGLN